MSIVFSYGLKLWSTNENYVKEAIRLFEKGIYQYIEIYMLPGTEQKMVDMWKELEIPYVVHAPHFMAGLNLAKREQKETNFKLIDETRRFADELSAENIIVHPGVAGNIEETAMQIKEINEPRIIVENKPYYALVDGLICNGATAEDIGFVMKEAEIGFCLDIGHAFCAARGLKKEPMEFLKSFLSLKPEMFHLTDGDYESIYDRHDHIGKGNYDKKKIVNLIPQGKRVAVETAKDSKDSLADFEEDIAYLKRAIC
jgi:endonuclease IV